MFKHPFHAIRCKFERETLQEGEPMYSSEFPAALLATGIAIERRVIRLINRIASASYTCTFADMSLRDVDS